MCIFHCQGLPVPRFWHLLSNLPWDVAVADVALAPTVARTDWLKAQAAMETMETMFCTILYWFSQILPNLFVDPFISLECLHPESSWQFLDRMPCWTGSPGTLSDTSCTGHHGWFDGEDSSSVIHIPSQYMYVSEIGINTRPFQQGKWWWTHEALDLGIPNLETNAYCPFHQEREGKGQIQRQYPAVVPSNSDKLLVPITVLSWWQCFPVQISVIWHLEEHIEGVERLLGVLSSETVWSAVDTKSSNPISILYCYQEDDGRCQPAPPLVFLCVSHIVFFVMRMSPC